MGFQALPQFRKRTRKNIRNRAVRLQAEPSGSHRLRREPPLQTCSLRYLSYLVEESPHTRRQQGELADDGRVGSGPHRSGRIPNICRGSEVGSELATTGSESHCLINLHFAAGGGPLKTEVDRG